MLWMRRVAMAQNPHLQFKYRAPLCATPTVPKVARRSATGRQFDAAARATSYTLGSVQRTEFTDHGAFVRALAGKVEAEREGYHSFAACCSTAIAEARKLAVDSTEPSASRPHRVVISTAAMLLTKLSGVVDRYGPLIRELLAELLAGIYAGATVDALLQSIGSAATDDDFSFLTTRDLYSDNELGLRGAHATLTLKAAKLTHTIDRTDLVVTKLLDRERDHRLAFAWRAWRWCVRGRREVTEHWLAARRRALCRSDLRVAMAEWRHFSSEKRKQRIASVGAANSERLMDHVRELTRQITVREEEIMAQRAGRDRAVERASSAEELLEHERMEGARLRTRLADADAKARSLLGMAVVVMGRIESALPVLATAPPRTVLQAAMNDGALRRGESTAKSFAITNVADTVAAGNVLAAVIQWVNDRLAEVDSTLRVANLEDDFADGRVYSQLLSIVSGFSAPPTTDSTVERVNHVLRAARSVHVDGGLTAADVLSTVQSVHLGLCTRLLQRYAVADRPGQLRAAVAKAAPSRKEGRDSSSLRARVADPPRPAGAPTAVLTTEALVTIMTRFEHLHVDLAHHRQWQQIALAAVNHAASSAALDARERDPEEEARRKEFALITPAKLHQMMPAGALRFAGSDAKDVTGDNDVTDALAALCTSLRGALLSSEKAFSAAFQHYCTCTKTDTHRPGAIDATGWAAFISDCALIPKVLSRHEADALLKVHNGSIEEADWPLISIRLFVSRDDVPSDPDDFSAQFKLFVQAAIVPCFPSSMIPRLSELLNDGSVQDILRLYREPLRKIFNDQAVKDSGDTGSTTPRFRIGTFATMCRELRVPVDEAEAMQLFAATRLVLCAADGAASAPGVGFLGFTGCACVMSLAKHGGNPLLPPQAAVKTFLVTAFFPYYQARLKLKW
jgi:hypothetical protein